MNHASQYLCSCEGVRNEADFVAIKEMLSVMLVQVVSEEFGPIILESIWNQLLQFFSSICMSL